MLICRNVSLVIISLFFFGCVLFSEGESAMSKKLHPKVIDDIHSIVQSEMTKIGVTNDVYVSAIVFYCRNDGDVRQGVLYLNDDASSVESYRFFRADRSLGESTSFSFGESLILKDISNILLEEGVKVASIQNVKIKWTAMKGERFLRGYISLDSDGNVLTNKFGSL